MFLYKCPYNYFFGLSCPGCGMTRAIFSLLQFDFKMAFYYHPLFPLVILLIIVGVLNYFKIIRLSENVKRTAFWIIVVMFFFVYVIRLFSGSDIVYFHPEESLIGRIINYISVFLE